MSKPLPLNVARAIETACKRLDWTVSKVYSGNGMMGRTCFGINHHCRCETNFVLMLLQEIDHDDLGEVLEALADHPEGTIESDNLGMGYITYWKYVTWPDNMEGVEQDDEPMPTFIRSKEDLLQFRMPDNSVNPNYTLNVIHRDAEVLITHINEQGQFKLWNNLSYWEWAPERVFSVFEKI